MNERGVPCIPTTPLRSETDSYDADDDDVLCMPYSQDSPTVAPASPGGNGVQGTGGLHDFADRNQWPHTARCSQATQICYTIELWQCSAQAI